MNIEKPDSPTTPDAPEPDRPDQLQDTEYTFNLGLYRIETLNNILEVCARRYKKAITSMDADDIREYQAIVNVLYTEAYIYMEEQTDFEHKEVQQDKDDILEKILDKRKSYSNRTERLQHLQKIRGVYLEVRKLLKKVKLDIPKEEKIGDTDVFTQT